MALLFGDIADACILDDTVCVTGHNWVACAFDRADPIVVTRLRGVVCDEGLREHVTMLASAADVYDAGVDAEGESWRVTVIVNGTKKIVILCRQIETEYRYYTESEARGLISSLKGRVAESELKAFLFQIKEHGVNLSFPN